jgi:glycoside/pentoside/hexuronide:cation symporter, GPH family
VNLPRKLAYSFGAMATALSYQAFSTYIIFFYVDVVKLPPYLAAIGMLIYGVWNAINDPLAGYLSDHTHSRWGRRIPYIALGAVPFGIVYYFMWVPPFTELDQVLPLFLYFVGFICLFDGFYTVTVLNWASLYPEMFPTLAERSMVNAFRQTFGMVGLLLGIVVPPLIYGGAGWGWMGAAFGAIISVALLISLRGSREHMEFSREKQLPFFASFKVTLGNRSFLTFVFSNFFVQYAFSVVLTTLPFFIKYVLEERAEGASLILAAAFLSAMPMLYVWQALAVRFGAKRCFMVAILVLASGLFPLLFVHNFVSAFLASFIIGVGLAGFILVADLILADVIDQDETITGTRREGMYFGANAFITRFALMLEVVSMGAILMKCGYNPYVFSQTREVIFGLRFLMGGLPVAALALAFIIICFYPLSGKNLDDMEDRVSVIHHKKGVN